MVERRNLLKLVVATLVATAASGVSGAAERPPIVIEIKDFEYGPEKAAVAVGDSVIWRNLDIVPHTVTAMDDSWDSGLIEAGGEWQTRVTEDMVSDYYCRYHPSMTASLRFQSSF